MINKDNPQSNINTGYDGATYRRVAAPIKKALLGDPDLPGVGDIPSLAALASDIGEVISALPGLDIFGRLIGGGGLGDLFAGLELPDQIQVLVDGVSDMLDSIEEFGEELAGDILGSDIVQGAIDLYKDGESFYLEHEEQIKTAVKVVQLVGDDKPFSAVAALAGPDNPYFESSIGEAATDALVRMDSEDPGVVLEDLLISETTNYMRTSDNETLQAIEAFATQDFSQNKYVKAYKTGEEIADVLSTKEGRQQATKEVLDMAQEQVREWTGDYNDWIDDKSQSTKTKKVLNALDKNAEDFHIEMPKKANDPKYQEEEEIYIKRGVFPEAVFKNTTPSKGDSKKYKMDNPKDRAILEALIRKLYPEINDTPSESIEITYDHKMVVLDLMSKTDIGETDVNAPIIPLSSIQALQVVQ